MYNKVFDVVIVGAGHAGLSLSYHLAGFGLKHLVLERACIAASWRHQRWDSFRLNTPNHLNKLPGEAVNTGEPNIFPTAMEFADNLKHYAGRYQLPVIENSLVTSISKDQDTGIFKIIANEKKHQEIYFAKQVVVASGSQNEIKIPELSPSIRQDVLQLHASQFRSAVDLPAGAVLVVGSAQSGCQIAEDLADQGKKVFLSTSMVPRLPRRYRGKDIIDWLLDTGFFEMPANQVKDPKIFHATAPQLSGANGFTVSLQSLALKGVVIVGRMASAETSFIQFEPNAAAHVKFADECSKNVKQMIDEFIVKNGLQVSAGDPDENDIADPDAACASDITRLDIDADNIKTIIWSTGFMKNHDYLSPLFDSSSETPVHVNGVSSVDGLYFLGLPWLRKRKSGLICGIGEDAEFIAEQLVNRWKYFRIRQDTMTYQ